MLEWRVKNFIDATVDLLSVQESIICDERRHFIAKETFDFNLKQLKENMDYYKGFDDIKCKKPKSSSKFDSGICRFKSCHVAIRRK